jgi:hypothetical protein
VSQEDGAARTVYQRAKIRRKKPDIFAMNALIEMVEK